ncbi:MAG: GumC family protein [Hyphomicrobiales bacterium]|nr:GumC family protein [Hyphomicrobiales bacterium]
MTPEASEAKSSALAAGSDEGLDLVDMARVLRARARTILASVLATTALGLAVIAMTPTTYRATTSLLIDPTIRAPLGAEPGVVAQGGPDTTLINSQVRILTSTSVLARVVKSQHLADDPAFNAPTGLFGRLKAMISRSTAAPGKAGRTTALAGALAKDIAVGHQDQSNVIDISVAARSPDGAANLANALVAAYFADQQQARDARAAADAVAMDTRIRRLRQQFLQSDAAYEAWRASHQLYDADGKPLGEVDLGNAAKILSDARAKTAAAKARFQQVEAVVASGRGVSTLSAALKSPLVDKLRSQYADVARQEAMYRATLGPRNPAYIQSQSQLRTISGLISNELKRIAANAASQYQEAQASEAAAKAQVAALKADSAKSSANSVQALQLKNDVDARRAVYQRFLRARDSVADAPVQGQLARVISPATPPLYPAAPAKKLILGLAIVIGLFLGAALALLGHMLATSTRPEAERPAPAPGDADAPAAHPSKASLQERSLAQMLDDILVEQAASEPSSRPLSLMVAALSPEAAQSLAALELAEAGAARGLRVLVIEADRATSAYTARLSRASGAPLVLAGRKRPCYALKSTPLVRIVPMLRAESAALAAMNQRQATIDGFGGNFDLVIFETGQLARDDRHADLAAHIDRVIFIAAPDQGGPANVSRALRHLDVSPDRLGGIWTIDPAEKLAA